MCNCEENQGPVVRTLPFSLENLRSVLPSPTMPLEDCPICKAIDGGGAKLIKGGELEYDTIPDSVQHLRYFMRLGEQVRTNWLEVCPQCQRLFYCEQSYEFLIGFGGSEDYWSYRIYSPEQVLELPEVSWANATGKGEIHVHEDGRWCIIHDAPNYTTVQTFGELFEKYGVPRLLVPNTPCCQYSRGGRYFTADSPEPGLIPFSRGVSYYRRKLGEGPFLGIKAYNSIPLGDFKRSRDKLETLPIIEVRYGRKYSKKRGMDIHIVLLALEEDVVPLSQQEIDTAIKEKRVLGVSSSSSMGDTYVNLHIVGPDDRLDDYGACFVFEPPCRLTNGELPHSQISNWDSPNDLFKGYIDYWCRDLPPDFEPKARHQHITTAQAILDSTRTQPSMSSLSPSSTAIPNDDQPSPVPGPAELFLSAQDLAQRWPTDGETIAPADRQQARRELRQAMLTLKQILKLVPRGARAVPAESFVSSKGIEAYRADPGQFSTRHLQAVLKGYRDRLDTLDRLVGRINERQRSKVETFGDLIEKYGVPSLVTPNTPFIHWCDYSTKHDYEGLRSLEIYGDNISSLRIPFGDAKYLLVKAQIEVPLSESKELVAKLKSQGKHIFEYQSWQSNVVRLTLGEDATPISLEELREAIKEKRVLSVSSWSSMGDGYIVYRQATLESLPITTGYHFLFDPPCRLLDSELPGSAFDPYESEDELFTIYRHYFTRDLPE